MAPGHFPLARRHFLRVRVSEFHTPCFNPSDLHARLAIAVAAGGVNSCMNSFVHTIMYGYYASSVYKTDSLLTSASYRLLLPLKPYLTTMQITQVRRPCCCTPILHDTVPRPTLLGCKTACFCAPRAFAVSRRIYCTRVRVLLMGSLLTRRPTLRAPQFFIGVFGSGASHFVSGCNTPAAAAATAFSQIYVVPLVYLFFAFFLASYGPGKPRGGIERDGGGKKKQP